MALLKEANRQLLLQRDIIDQKDKINSELVQLNSSLLSDNTSLNSTVTELRDTVLAQLTQIAELKDANSFQQQTIQQQVQQLNLKEEVIIAMKQSAKEREKLITKQEKQIEKLQLIKHSRKMLAKSMFGRKSEKTHDDYELVDSSDAENTKEDKQIFSKTWINAKEKEPRKKNREFDPSIPRETVYIDAQNVPLNAIKVGERVTEQLHFRRVDMYIKRTIRSVYLVPDENEPDKFKNIMAPLPPHPVPKCKADISILVQVLIDKYLYHLPIFRQAARFEQYGVRLPYNTIVDWANRSCEALEELYKLMIKEAIKSGILHCDESPILTIDLSKKKGKKSHRGQMWVLANPVQNFVCFWYGMGRGHKDIKEILEGYTGFLHTDDLKTYKKYGKQKGVKHGKCLTHCRRKFVEAKSNDPTRSRHVLKTFINPLYLIERKCRDENLSYDEITDVRQTHAVPILEAMFEWLAAEKIKVTPRTPIYIAINYLLNMKEEIMLYTTDGMLNIDNNIAERLIRDLAIGRKNFMFAGSHNGAKNAAIIYTFIGSCKLQGINPTDWLTDVFQRISTTPADQLKQLLPQSWKSQQTESKIKCA